MVSAAIWRMVWCNIPGGCREGITRARLPVTGRGSTTFNFFLTFSATKAAGGHSAISLMQSISAYETNIFSYFQCHQGSRWSLCHFSHAVYLSLRDKHAALITQVSSPSLHELMSTNIRSFHVHFSIGTLLSAEVRLKYSLSASKSADLVD